MQIYFIDTMLGTKIKKSLHSSYTKFMRDKKYFSVDEIRRKLERYCIYQDRCNKEVEQKLGEFNLILEAKEIILLHLLEHNFLNEERFAKSFARGKFRIKKWGKQRIIRELKFRYISERNIKTALKEIDEQAYLQTICEITEERNAQITDKNILKRKRKLTDFLLRKGYKFDLILSTVEAVLKNT